MESYGRKTGIWNEIYAEYQAVDLRNTDLTVEPGFDNCLREFGEKPVTYWILDAEQEILFFNISRIFRGKKALESMRRNWGLNLQGRRQI